MRNRVRLGGSSFAPLAHEILSCQAARTDLRRRLRPYVGCIDHNRVQQASLLTSMSVPRCRPLGDAYPCMRGIETGVEHGTIEESPRKAFSEQNRRDALISLNASTLAGLT
jgi:hypothetical protein